VAIKVLSSHLASRADFRIRFVRESKAAAAVDHPNIIPIYEAGESDGQLFIAMRYVKGGDLQSFLEGHGALPPAQVAEIIAATAGALDAAHSAGLVHRDVKPGNILLDSRSGGGPGEPHVYIADWGITSVASAGPDGGMPDDREDFPVLGTPDYMAPEAMNRQHVDGKADQWSLACCAFTLLAGSLPFLGLRGRERREAIAGGPQPPLSARRPELPPAADEVFRMALAADPASRFASCRQFALALAAALASADTQVPGPMVFSRPLDIPLKRTFRYVHEPYRSDDEALASLGNDSLVATLESRVRHSRGGALLITGFKGVGKTTVVMRALDELRERCSPSTVVLPVVLGVARATTTEQLMFAIVRRIFETLHDTGTLQNLPPQTQHALIVAYTRTSLSFKETQSKSRDGIASLSVGPGSLVKTVAEIAVPSATMSTMRSQSLATEAAFLAYSETDAEHDLMRIVSLVGDSIDPRPSRMGSLMRRTGLRRVSRRPGRRLHLVIVLDEVDKLTADPAGLAMVEDLLTGLRKIFALPSVHFLIVGGPDLHDRARLDTARGNGVYESVFGYRMYVPCAWDAAALLVSSITNGHPGASEQDIDAFVQYLGFKARGVPRRLLQSLNDFIDWDDEQPRLRISATDADRIEFYARVERIMRDFMDGGAGGTMRSQVPIDVDRWRLGNYYVADWVLESEGRPFSASQLLQEGEDARFDPLLRISPRSIDELLDHLARHGILDVVRDEANANLTMVADVAGSDEKVFRLSADIQSQLYGLAVMNESERYSREISLALSANTSTVARSARRAKLSGGDLLRSIIVPLSTGQVSGVLLGDRYEVDLQNVISQGALSLVYKGRDVQTGRPVMVKELRHAFIHDEVALARFRREAEILQRLSHHPQVARMHKFLDGPETYAIILERLSGPTLEEMVADDGPMPPDAVVAMAQILADGLDYIAARNIVRIDLKPGNIIMADRGPVITDLGVAFPADRQGDDFATGTQIIGTPAFMPPEVIEGRDPDPRAEVYGLGLVMYYCLAGQTPWEGIPNIAALWYAIVTEDIDLSALPVSGKLRAVMAQALARDRDSRFPSASAMRQALLGTPEWQSVVGVPSSPIDLTTVRRPRAPGGPAVWDGNRTTVTIPPPGANARSVDDQLTRIIKDGHSPNGEGTKP
jgi:serine/threonine protein kinase